MPCGQLEGPTTVPAAAPEKPSQGPPGCFRGSPGVGQEELQQPGRQAAGACGHAAPAGPCSPGGGAPLRQGSPSARHTVSVFNKPYPDRVFIKGNHTER